MLIILKEPKTCGYFVVSKFTGTCQVVAILRPFKFFIFHLTCMIYCLHVYLCTMCMPDTHGGQKRASDPLNWSYRQSRVSIWVVGTGFSKRSWPESGLRELCWEWAAVSHTNAAHLRETHCSRRFKTVEKWERVARNSYWLRFEMRVLWR